MAISEFSNGPKRRRVGFVGAMPEGAAEALIRRGYDPYNLCESQIGKPGCFETTGSIILTQDVANPERIRSELKTFSGALNHDCRVYVRYITQGDKKDLLLRALNRQKLPSSGFVESERKFFVGDWVDQDSPVYAPFVHILEADENWDQFANTIAHNTSGHSPSSTLQITVEDTSGGMSKLESEHELLIRRAFWNCRMVRLYAKANGQSGVSAYEVYAYLADNEVGGEWPYRFFVKIGGRAKVAREFHKYGTTLLENVPFHLGPRLRLERCVLGRSCGLIVSDFVSGAEPIRDSAREGRGIAAISNLFNVTLLAWRRAAKNESRPLGESLKALLRDDNAKDRTVPSHRKARLAEFTASRPIADLIQIVNDMSESAPVLTGMVHGDLHATNVLVRMNDAVIIDLERVHISMPQLFDAASLEAGLFVDGFIKDKRSARDILNSVSSLYEIEAFEKDDHHCDPSDGSSWFTECVRQIRMQAKQMERAHLQYAWMLGVVFLKKACNKDDFAENQVVTFDSPPTCQEAAREAARTLAYVIGERIILGLASKRQGKP
ncbi:MAG: phosphotransferase [Casimicrobiaceae bacterium]